MLQPPQSDVLIVGAGPAGLSLAIALAQAGLRSTLIEQHSAASLADPPADGREIALTHPSVATLQRLGSWQALAPHEIGSIAAAQVHDGPVGQRSALELAAGVGASAGQPLGFIVSNQALRRSAYACAVQQPLVHIVSSAQVQQVAVQPGQAQLEYRDSTGALHALAAPLLVAADSRFSATRRQLGIGAAMQDFGRTVIVCRLRHALPHQQVAHECFGYARTLAILPLPDTADGAPQCSAVVTTDSADAAALLTLPAEEFAALVQTQFQQRLGAMTLIGERHAYPLVAVYARQFSGPRCALLGDAAVGMHPVTAHGYNLGLSGVERLSQVLVQARQQGQDIGSASVLAGYARAQHQHAWPIYQGTNAIVRLYTDDRAPARLLRQLVLQGARHLPPLQAAIVSQLTGRAPAWLRPLQPGLRQLPPPP